MGNKVWTAAELDEMTPAQIDVLFQESLVTDLSDVPTALVAKMRADVEARANAGDAPKRQ